MGFAFRKHDNCTVCGILMESLAGFTFKFEEPHRKEYSICFNCIKETSSTLKEIKLMNEEFLPLYINHKNIFV
jgi:hypothetical protein